MRTEYLIIAAILIFILAFFLGWIFGKKSHKYKPDGTLVIEELKDRDSYRWVFNEDLEDFQKRKNFTLKFRTRKIHSLYDRAISSHFINGG